MNTQKEEWNRSEWQGKSRKRVEGYIYGFIVSAALLILVLLILIIENT